MMISPGPAGVPARSRRHKAIPVYADPVRPPNNARFVFLSPHTTEFFRHSDEVADDTVAMLRAEAGRDLYDRRLTDRS
ncbi:hypothetical protein ACIGXF_15095 [Streptomyces sp. NPDC053086]|uniref:MmyB family transcriptional regulator n=1 Tax=unclassified Streptomyces TaxID=2593676 RepID=UPI0037D11C5E